MANIPSKPTVTLQEWIDEQTPLDHDNLTGGINGNLSTLKTAVDGLIDALGGAGSEPPEGIFYISGELIPESPDDPVEISLTSAEVERLLDDRINQIIAYDDLKNRVYFFNKETHSIDENEVYFYCNDYYAYVAGDSLIFGEKQPADVLELTSNVPSIGVYPETSVSLTLNQLRAIYNGVDKIVLTLNGGHTNVKYYFTKTGYDAVSGQYYYSCRLQDFHEDGDYSERSDQEYVAHVKNGVQTLFVSRSSRLYYHSISFTGTAHVGYMTIISSSPNPCDFDSGYDAEWGGNYIETIASVDDIVKQITYMYIENGSIYLTDASGTSISDTYTSYTESIRTS